MEKRLGCRGYNLLVLVPLGLALVLSAIAIIVSLYIIRENREEVEGSYIKGAPVSGITNSSYSILATELNKPEVKRNTSKVVQAPMSEYQDFEVPEENSNKTYMDADCIRGTACDAYKFKQYYKMSDVGIWTVNGRYCAAVGSFYTTDIGTEFDVVLTSGEVLKCVLADCKDDTHTDETNRQNPNGSVVEFVVEISSLPELARKMGDLSHIGSSFEGEIDYIRVYGGKEWNLVN